MYIYRNTISTLREAFLNMALQSLFSKKGNPIPPDGIGFHDHLPNQDQCPKGKPWNADLESSSATDRLGDRKDIGLPAAPRGNCLRLMKRLDLQWHKLS